MEEKHSYMIRWQQKYPEWEKVVDEYYDIMLQSSNFKEALEVISKIKSTLKD